MIARPRTLHLAAVAAFAVAVLALAPIAVAGKGGGGGHGKPGGGGTTGGTGGTISLSSPLVKDVNGDGLPNWGDTVQFNVATTATTQPYVHLKCFQNGVLVAEGWRGYFADSMDYPYFGLSAPSWMGGAADCTATLEKGSTATGYTQLASTSFHVGA